MENYKINKKRISYFNCCRELVKLKKELMWLKEPDKFALEYSLKDLDDAYQNYFKFKKKLPKFKSKKKNKKSYRTRYTNNNIKIDFNNNKIKLPKLKEWVKCKLHRQFNGKIKFATISQVPSGKYFVSILVEVEINQLPKNNNLIAFDLGIKEFLIDSNNIHIENPKILYKYEKKLAKLQRQHSKKINGSKNKERQRIKIAKLHEKITNIRKDFLHKLSSKIINENQVIISEDLSVKNMLANNKNINKAIKNLGIYEFIRQLFYKSNWYSRTYHKIDRWFASSQICSECGYINKEVKLLSIREWVCIECGVKHQRDENAAKNILQQGLKELGVVS